MIQPLNREQIEEVRALLPSLSYKSGWTFKIGGPFGTMLCVFATTPDSNNPRETRTTQHMFSIPPMFPIRTTSDGFEPDPILWLRHCLEKCERHELGEFLRIDGEAPFMPNHQDEGDPYVWVDRR